MPLRTPRRSAILGLALAATMVASACETVGTVLEPDVPDAMPGRDATTYVPEDAASADAAWLPDAGRDAASPDSGTPDAAGGEDAAMTTDASADAGSGDCGADAGAADGDR